MKSASLTHTQRDNKDSYKSPVQRVGGNWRVADFNQQLRETGGILLVTVVSEREPGWLCYFKGYIRGLVLGA